MVSPRLPVIYIKPSGEEEEKEEIEQLFIGQIGFIFGFIGTPDHPGRILTIFPRWPRTVEAIRIVEHEPGAATGRLSYICRGVDRYPAGENVQSFGFGIRHSATTRDLQLM